MRWGSACPPEGGFWLPGLAVSFQPRQVNIAFGTGQHFCAGHAFSRALISRLSAAERPVMHAEIRMSENCRYTPHYGPADQLIRWAKFTMNPSGPRTDAMRQMPSD